MQIEMPLIGADVALDDAVGALRQSKGAGLVMLKGDGALLFHAPDLYDLLAEGKRLSMGEVAGGLWLPFEAAVNASPEPGPAAMVIRTAGRNAVLRFYSNSLYARVATRMYYCDKNSKHHYDSTQVKSLTPIAPGQWECGQGDMGVVS
jgi:hypothetical protein